MDIVVDTAEIATASQVEIISDGQRIISISLVNLCGSPPHQVGRVLVLVFHHHPPVMYLIILHGGEVTSAIMRLVRKGIEGVRLGIVHAADRSCNS